MSLWKTTYSNPSSLAANDWVLVQGDSGGTDAAPASLFVYKDAAGNFVADTTGQHFRMQNGGQIGVISLGAGGTIDIWAHGDGVGDTVRILTGVGSGTERAVFHSLGLSVSGNVSCSGIIEQLNNQGYYQRNSANSPRRVMLLHSTDIFYIGGVDSDPNEVRIRTAGADRGVFNSGGLQPGVDNSLQLGSSSLRWSIVYAATGTINTSDAREKHWLGDLTEAHLRAARRIGCEIGVFQWLADLERKGEAARIHIGPRAQRVWQIMIDEGLEAPTEEGERPSARHAFLCYDEWEEEREEVLEGWRPSKVIGRDGEPKMVKARKGEEATEWRPTGGTRVKAEAGKRYGLRLDQLALFLIAAQEARLAALEAAA